MTPHILYILAFISLAIGTMAIYGALINSFPVKLLYWHYFLRRPLVWGIFAGTILWVAWFSIASGSFPLWTVGPLLLMALAMLLTEKMHQSRAFPAVDYPPAAGNLEDLPLTDEMEMAVIEYGGVTRAYPLDYVIHHHIINDRFGDKIVALTYCAMCRTVIPFDVTDIGPLFVASFKNSNMIVADRKTKTYFQQASFQSIIGKLHPHELSMIGYQLLTWGELRMLSPIPLIPDVNATDFREFKLPIPGIWKKIVGSEATPGLPAKSRDKQFPARTRVIGILDPALSTEVVYIKKDISKQGVVRNDELGILLVGTKNTVNVYRDPAREPPLDLTLTEDHTLLDRKTGSVWDLRGRHLSGSLTEDFEPVTFSDEYWFSWKHFHPDARVEHLTQ